MLVGGLEAYARELRVPVPGMGDEFPVDEVFAGVYREAWKGDEGGEGTEEGFVDVDATSGRESVVFRSAVTTRLCCSWWRTYGSEAQPNITGLMYVEFCAQARGKVLAKESVFLKDTILNSGVRNRCICSRVLLLSNGIESRGGTKRDLLA